MKARCLTFVGAALRDMIQNHEIRTRRSLVKLGTRERAVEGV